MLYVTVRVAWFLDLSTVPYSSNSEQLSAQLLHSGRKLTSSSKCRLPLCMQGDEHSPETKQTYDIISNYLADTPLDSRTLKMDR